MPRDYKGECFGEKQIHFDIAEIYPIPTRTEKVRQRHLFASIIEKYRHTIR